MTDTPPVPEAQGEKLARTIAHHVGETHKANAAHETHRRLLATAAAASAFHEQLAPALAGLFDELLKVVPDDHPMRPLIETFATKTKS
jgi:hypothetical protein